MRGVRLTKANGLAGNSGPTADHYRETSLQKTDFQNGRDKGSDRMPPERVMLVSLWVQLALSLTYGMGLYFLNTWNSEITQWLTQHLSVITDPVARLLPVTRYAETLTNPTLYLPAVLIRHVFSLLMLINAVPGIAWFGICKELADGYKRSLEIRPQAVKNANYLFLLLVVVATFFLFIAPLIDAALPLTWTMDLLLYFWGCMSPTFFFFSLLQVVAIQWAYGKAKANCIDRSAR